MLAVIDGCVDGGHVGRGQHALGIVDGGLKLAAALGLALVGQQFLGGGNLCLQCLDGTVQHGLGGNCKFANKQVGSFSAAYICHGVAQRELTRGFFCYCECHGLVLPFTHCIGVGRSQVFRSIVGNKSEQSLCRSIRTTD